jgi:hypothetical protein
MRNPPDPNLDTVEAIYLAPDGSGSVGLWGFIDPSTKKPCTVRASDGSGRIVAADKRGSNVLVFKFAGISDGATIQAFSGAKPFSEPIPVVRRGSGNIVAENKRILQGGGAREVCQIGGQPVKVLPMSKGFGNYMHAPQMAEVNGLAVHITAGYGSLELLRSILESRSVSSHFGIDREGRIAQYVAASYQSQAQGPGNPNWISVEMVGAQVKGPAFEPMTAKQIVTLRNLWQWVYMTFPRPSWNVASPYTGLKALGYRLENHFQRLAMEFEDRGYAKPGSKSIVECDGSTGLSCHYWLDTRIKPCPGAAMMSQLPEVLGYDRVRIKGDEAFVPG